MGILRVHASGVMAPRDTRMGRMPGLRCAMTCRGKPLTWSSM